MRILWLINRILPMFYKELGMKETSYGGGWLTGLSNSLRKTEGIELAVCAPFSDIEENKSGSIDRVKYYLYPEKDFRQYDSEAVVRFREIDKEFKPDVIHIFGTEYPQTLEMIDAIGSDRVLISLTGILNEYFPWYRGGIPSGNIKRHTLIRKIASGNKKLFFLQNRLICYGEDDFKNRAFYETEALKKAKYVTGRTAFDRNFALKSNPAIKYYFCNESLRDTFYEPPCWKYELCEKHSIFISNSGYPIKGFHKMLEASEYLIRDYPDLKIYVAGNSPYSSTKGLKNKILQVTDEYGMYIQKLIKKFSLNTAIHFMGNLNEQEMKKTFLKANVFVLPSAIENSPNSLGEAMILKVPCVASDVGGVSDMIVDEKEGFLYQFDNVKALAAAVDRIFKDAALATEIGHAAFTHAAETHSIQNNNNTMISIYTDIAK